MHIDLGIWTAEELDRLIRDASHIGDPGQRIAFLSQRFLGTFYQESTLIGDEHTPEELVINFRGVDCFTFLDYVEAMRISGSFIQFRDILKRVRYRNSIVSFKTRNHFFTDWIDYNAAFVEDVTAQIAGGQAGSVQKVLNQKEDGSLLLKGIEPKRRTVTFIPADGLDENVMQGLRTGDYAGIYSEMPCLDVSHVGIIIRKADAVSLRHASSATAVRKVIDQPLRDAMAGKPGLIVLRPLKG
jgi:hypothetical protein